MNMFREKRHVYLVADLFVSAKLDRQGAVFIKRRCMHNLV